MTSTSNTERRLRRLENDRDDTYLLVAQIAKTQDKHTDQLAHITATLADHNNRFEQIDTRFEQIDARFEQIDTRFGQIDTQLTGLHAQLAGLTTTLDRVVELVTPRAE